MQYFKLKKKQMHIGSYKITIGLFCIFIDLFLANVAILYILKP